MREFNQIIDEKYFNMLWRALSKRESEIYHSIDNDPDSDESALMNNDLVYLKLCMKELEEKAKSAKFADSAFSLDDGYVDLQEI